MTGTAIHRLTDAQCAGDTNSTLNCSALAMAGSGSGMGPPDPCEYTVCQQKQIDIAVTLSLLVGILMVSKGREGGREVRREGGRESKLQEEGRKETMNQ